MRGLTPAMAANEVHVYCRTPKLRDRWRKLQPGDSAPSGVNQAAMTATSGSPPALCSSLLCFLSQVCAHGVRGMRTLLQSRPSPSLDIVEHRNNPAFPGRTFAGIGHYL